MATLPDVRVEFAIRPISSRAKDRCKKRQWAGGWQMAFLAAPSPCVGWQYETELKVTRGFHLRLLLVAGLQREQGEWRCHASRIGQCQRPSELGDTDEAQRNEPERRQA
jgi:hypothetical protein